MALRAITSNYIMYYVFGIIMDQTGTYLINVWKATGSHVERIGGYRKSHEAISMGRAKGGRY